MRGVRRGLVAGSVLLMGTVAGCTSSSGDTPGATGSTSSAVNLSVLQPRSGSKLPPAGDLPPYAYSATEITDGMVSAAVDKVDAISQAVMQRSRIPGMAVAVVHHSEVVFAKGYGVREVGKPDPVTPETVFQIASVSKSISGTCIAKEVSDKRVSWSDPASKYLADLKLSDPDTTRLVTVGDLFSHRSGLPGPFGDDLEGYGFDRAQILAKLDTVPLDPFRISYNYSNFGMTTGGEAVARAVGLPWDQMCARDLLQPLGMTKSTYSHAQFAAETDTATLHVPTDDGYRPLYQRNADAQAPAGGLSSTVGDLSKWMSMVLAGGKVGEQQVIDPDVLLQNFTPQVRRAPMAATDARGAFYGYGVNIDTESTGQVYWQHSGAFYIGAATAYGLIPSADVGIIVLTNARPNGAAEAVTTTFNDYVRTGSPERDWYAYYSTYFTNAFTNRSPVVAPAPATPKPARPLSSYVGTYANAYLGDVRVTESGGTLTVTIGPKGLSAPLTHYDGDVFSWMPPGEGHNPISAVTFGGGSGDSAAQTMNVERTLLPDLTRTG